MNAMTVTPLLVFMGN
ncbi:putative ABC transporter ATP-binding protein, partial [Haemophilus influenzae]